MKQINSRTEKINFLQKLKQGKATINELLPQKIELWKQYTNEPGIYINEKTGEKITAAQMEVKQKNKGSNVLFITIYYRSGHVQ